MNKLKEILNHLRAKVEGVKELRYSILIYVGTIFLVSIWLLFVSPCFMNLLLPVFALLVPYKFYKEESLKKVLIAGVIAILIFNVTASAYRLNLLYNQPSSDLSLDDGSLSEGTVNPLYGNPQTRFNFTVKASEEIMNSANHTIFVNITYSDPTTPTRNIAKSVKMERSTEDASVYYAVENVSERIYYHNFALKENVSDNEVNWRETEAAYGPVTIEKRAAFGYIMGQQSLSSLFIYGIVGALLWWKRKMDRSKEVSTEGLEDKEEKLEDYCQKCGALLEGKKVCPRCGEEIEEVDEDGEETTEEVDEDNIEEEDEQDNE